MTDVSCALNIADKLVGIPKAHGPYGLADVNVKTTLTLAVRETLRLHTHPCKRL